MAIISATAKATKEAGDEQTYDFAYKLKVDSTGTTVGTNLKWTLFEENAALVLDEGKTTCGLVKEPGVGSGGNEIHYYYTANGQKNDGGQNDCTKNLLSTKLSSFSNPVASGTINKGSVIVSDDGEENLNKSIEDVSDENGKTKYYYLVVEYPNDASSQNDADMGNNINVSLVLDGNVTASVSE